MPEFKVGEDVKTDTPTVDVTPTAAEPLLPGVHVFQLVVVDDDDNASQPATVSVTVQDPGPTAVIRAPRNVVFGNSFTLDGSQSSDVAGGKIVRYVWTLVQ